MSSKFEPIIEAVKSVFVSQDDATTLQKISGKLVSINRFEH